MKSLLSGGESVCQILNVLLENSPLPFDILRDTNSATQLAYLCKTNANESIEPFVCLLPSWEHGSPDNLLLQAFILSRRVFLIRARSL